MVFAPSRTRDTSAPASGFPRLSRTVPVIVASDLFEAVTTAPLDTNDTSAMTDKLRRNILFMRDLRDQSPFGSQDRRTGSGEGDLPGTAKQVLIFDHAATSVK